MKKEKLLKALIVTLLVNIIAFTTILWGGAYLIHLGHTWVAEPRGTSLPCLGIVKLFLMMGIVGVLVAMDDEAKKELIK